MKTSMRIVAVIGSGNDSHKELSAPLGRGLAEKGYNLINGGGHGVMQATSEAFYNVKTRLGKVIGVLPSQNPCESANQRSNYKNPPGYPNSFIELSIKTHLHLTGEFGNQLESRNHIIVLTADIIIALPGGSGTRSEIQLSLDYNKPLILLTPHGEWDEFNDKNITKIRTVEETLNLLTQQF